MTRNGEGGIWWVKCPHCGGLAYPMTLDLLRMLQEKKREKKKE